MNHLHSANLENGFYMNPILFGNFSDPSVLRDGQDYFMIHSSVGYRTMLLWHSKNLTDWKPLYYVLEGAFEDPDLASQLSVWAPELIKCKGKYYIYNYSPKYGLWVIVSDDIIAGNWTKPKFLEGAEGIDPGHIQDDSGKRWLLVSKNILYPLSDDGLFITGKGKRICDDWPIPDDWDIEGICTESPKVIKKNGFYYLTVAQGGTAGPATSHAIISFRSRNLEGPYEASPQNPIVHTWSKHETWWSKGHGTLVDTPAGNWYILYHGMRNGHRYLGRFTLMEPLEWTNDGWFKIPDHIATDKPIPMPYGEKVTHKISLSDSFTSGKLGLMWNTKSSRDYAKIRFNKPGIILDAQGDAPSNGTCIWMPPQHHLYEIQMQVTLNQPETGAALGYEFGSFLNAGIVFKGHAVWVYHLDHHYLAYVTKRVLTSNMVWLKLKNNYGTISPWYSLDGVQWIKINSCFEINDWNSNSGSGFGYAKPCISVFGAGFAKISEFIYQPLLSV